MLLHDVDFPQSIIDAQKHGQLVIFAGAGVSIDLPANYPDFIQLAADIGGASNPPRPGEPVDRYLGRLHEEKLAVHERVQRRLSLPDSRPNHLHKSLLRLFGKLDAIRIVTTNFDDHFRGASQEMFGEPPEVYSAPALPLGQDFKGIVHLHGSVRGEPRNLVLTDADFGRAYLTQGWARRFIQQLFSEFVVLFVGYSHQDLPLLYLARGMSAASSGPGRYALTPPASDTDWINLGIAPIHYPLRAAPAAPHGGVGDCLAKWAELANLGSLGTEENIKRIVTSERPITKEESDFLKQSLRETHTRRFFVRHARLLRWLEWIREEPDFRALFAPGLVQTEASQELAFWFAEAFAIQHFGPAIEVVREMGQTLSSHLWFAVAQAFHRAKTAGEPMRFWVPIITATTPINANSDLLAYMLDCCTMPDDTQTVLHLFRKLTEPTLSLRRRFRLGDDPTADTPDAEIQPIGSDFWVNRAYLTNLRPHLEHIGRDIAMMVTAAFEQACALSEIYGKAGPKWDPLSFSRGSTASRMQDHLHNGFSTLIDAGADVLDWANRSKPDFSRNQISQWIESSAPILRRLAIGGMIRFPALTDGDKLSWIIEKRLIDNFQLKNETFALLSAVYGGSPEETRRTFLAQAEETYKPNGEDYERYELYNLLSWLNTCAPDCILVSRRLGEVQETQPGWIHREHPDFNSWIGGGVHQTADRNPILASRIAEMNLKELLDESERLAGIKDPFGDTSQEGSIEGIARTAESNFGWSMTIANSALAGNIWSRDVWSGLLRGWSSAHDSAQWETLLSVLDQLTPVHEVVLYELTSLLKDALERKDGGLPVGQLDHALDLAELFWKACERKETPLEDTSTSWVGVAINRPGSHLIDFYFDALRSIWSKRAENQSIIRRILHTFSVMIGGESPASELVRVLIVANAELLAGADLNWYQNHVLPLLASPDSPRTREQCWDGFLTWGRWSQAMLPKLLPAYLDHLPTVATGSDERSRMYSRHLGAAAMFGSVDPIQHGWLDAFIARAPLRERLSWATEIRLLLRDADEQLRETTWNRWLRAYWQRRIEATPIPIDSVEAGAMIDWALALRVHFRRNG